MVVLSDSALLSIRNTVKKYIGDSSISTTISYNLTGSTVSSWNPTTQTIPAIYATSSVSAFKASYTLKDVEESGGVIEQGDVKMIIEKSSVSGILSVDDLVWEASTDTQSGTTYIIKNNKKDPINMAYFLRCRAI